MYMYMYVHGHEHDGHGAAVKLPRTTIPKRSRPCLWFNLTLLSSPSVTSIFGDHIENRYNHLYFLLMMSTLPIFPFPYYGGEVTNLKKNQTCAVVSSNQECGRSDRASCLRHRIPLTSPFHIHMYIYASPQHTLVIPRLASQASKL